MRRVAVGGLLAALSSTFAVGGFSPPAAAGAQASAAPADLRPAVGVQFHAMWSDYTNQQRLEVLDKLAAAGVEWVRIDMGWSSFQEDCRTCFSQWYIDRADYAVDQARARGLKVLATLWRTPSWANGGNVYEPPDDPADYGTFAGWAAEHFRGRVSAWEVWNEPNLDGFFQGSVREYVDLLKAAYPEFKSADPGALVVLGGPAYNDTNWLEAVYARGAQGFFDVMATHPYQAPSDLPPETPDPDGSNIWLLTHVESVRDLMVARGDGGKEIWFTEFGWSAHDTSPGAPNWKRGVTAAQQGDFMLRAIEFVKGNYPYVTHMFWYNERNRATGDVHLDNYGLMKRDLTPKPGYQVLREYLVEGVRAPGGCTIRGTSGNDLLVGTVNDDVICGGAGHDTLVGGGGDDVLIGGRGRDTLEGGWGRDTLQGGPGHDTLVGGGGDDTVKGGPGRDILKGGRGRNVARGGLGTDRLYLRDGRANDLGVGGGGWDLCTVDRGDVFRGCPRLRSR